MAEVLSKFAENLDTLAFDAGLNGKELAEAIGVKAPTVYNLLNGKRQPSVGVLVRLAERFGVSVDFLLGRSPERRHETFCPCPPWREQVAFLLGYFKVTKYRLCKDTPVTRSVFYAWLKGAEPELNSVLRLADRFGCSVDFILGREK